MTKIKFIELCKKHLIKEKESMNDFYINLDLILENEALKEALLKRDDDLVIKILKNDF